MIEVINSSNAKVLLRLRNSSLKVVGWSATDHSVIGSTDHLLAEISLSTGSIRTLLTSTSPITDARSSPNARLVAFARDNKLLLFDPKNGTVRPIAQATENQKHFRVGVPDPSLATAFHQSTAFWWSPDSSSIAWLATNWMSPTSGHGNFQSKASIPLVRLMVTNVETLRTTVMNTGSQTDVYLPRVQWLPDGQHVAVEKLNREQTTVELLIASVLDGVCRSVLKEEDPYWINIHDDLAFLKDGIRFIWSSERTGYRHLYLCTVDGSKDPVPITSGSWEVSELLKIDEAKQCIYFASTQASPAERQIYSVHLDGSSLMQLTSVAGVHVANFSPDGNRFIDNYSSAISEPCASIIYVKSLRSLTLDCRSPWRSTEASFSPVTFLHVNTQDGISLSAMMIKPANFDANRHYPVIVYTNSGPGQQAVMNGWNGWISLWHQFMASKGYIIFSIDSRGAGGYGHIFEEPIHFRLGAQETSDLRDAGAYLRSLAYVDRMRIAIWGIRYGGFLSLHVIFKDVEFQKAAAILPIIDLEEESISFSERYLGTFSAHQNEFDQSSPMADANRMRGKLLLASDSTTATTLQHELRAAGKQIEMLRLSSQVGEDQSQFPLALLLRRLTQFFTE